MKAATDQCRIHQCFDRPSRCSQLPEDLQNDLIAEVMDTASHDGRYLRMVTIVVTVDLIEESKMFDDLYR